MGKLTLLSDNLILILKQLLGNQALCKLIAYNDKTPLDPILHPNFDTEPLLLEKIFPTPFDDFTTKKDFSQVRAYYSRVDLKDDVVENNQLIFDVIIAKNLWMIKNQSGGYVIRPYEIVSEIANTFHMKSIGTLGRVQILGFRHIPVNEKFDAIQISAKVTTFTEAS